MKKTITPNQIRENNRKLIYQYIYHHPKVAQRDIAYELHLSRPTITTNLAAMEEEGLIEKGGQIANDYVGRKADAYSINPLFRVGIGVEILSQQIKIIAVNLYGQKIHRMVFDIKFADTDAYFAAVCQHILKFAAIAKLSDEQILGIGFAMQGLVSPDGTKIIYGKILECTGLEISAIQKYLPYPCTFIHDADCAAISELWASPEMKNAFYLSLSRHLAAAIIVDRKQQPGMHGHSATIEHIPMEADGKLCYCGRRGCLETVCAIHALLPKDGDLDQFFALVRKGDAAAWQKWQTYLGNLAKAINMLQLVYDQIFILGGYLAPYFIAEDIEHLYDLINGMTPFLESRDYLQISKMPKHNITIGAALPYIQQFLES